MSRWESSKLSHLRNANVSIELRATGHSIKTSKNAMHKNGVNQACFTRKEELALAGNRPGGPFCNETSPGSLETSERALDRWTRRVGDLLGVKKTIEKDFRDTLRHPELSIDAHIR